MTSKKELNVALSNGNQPVNNYTRQQQFRYKGKYRCF